ncbi:hypothetical protein B5S31_g5608 [[Candida] boidinii]|nr:hypothetical protein B5S29_g4249 [[Candida] boidinii]OWB75670.1 hypothetical protein B5S31_g5608 [[Candida] boidinii]OWB78826.1 hypothetical protein B5S32_g3030 [[Candida] boidinii]
MQRNLIYSSLNNSSKLALRRIKQNSLSSSALKRNFYSTSSNTSSTSNKSKILIPASILLLAAGSLISLNSSTIKLESKSEKTKTTTTNTNTNTTSTIKENETFPSDEQSVQSAEKNLEEKLEESQEEQSGAYNPETGEINWDCPCLGGMANGPCGEDFKAAFSCFVYSEEEPKGIDCIEKFKAMQDCFRKYPEIYSEELRDDDEYGDVPSSDSQIVSEEVVVGETEKGDLVVDSIVTETKDNTVFVTEEVDVISKIKESEESSSK